MPKVVFRVMIPSKGLRCPSLSPIRQIRRRHSVLEIPFRGSSNIGKCVAVYSPLYRVCIASTKQKPDSPSPSKPYIIRARCPSSRTPACCDALYPGASQCGF